MTAPSFFTTPVQLYLSVVRDSQGNIQGRQSIVGVFFVIPAKHNTKYQHRYFHPVDESNSLKCDQTIVLTGVNSTTDDLQQLCGTCENRY